MRTLITRARLIDGTWGAKARSGALLVEDDRIAAVGDAAHGPAPDVVIDAGGMVVCPGFVDAHSHGDFVLPADPGAAPKVGQGITTEVVGNCGLGLAPANRRVEAMYRQYGKLFGEDGDVACSPSLADYRGRLEHLGVAVNVACLVPHGNLRCAVMGLEERAATPTEQADMEALLEAQLEQGAVGVSSGLVYPPGAFASTEELAGLAAVAARRGGLYASHVRDEGNRLEAAVGEALTIGRRSGAAVQISHHKAAGRANWGKVRHTLAMLDAARRDGLDVHSDMYPYTAGSTMLAALVLPSWVFAADTPEESLRRLSDPELRPLILRDMRRRLEGLINLPGMLNHLPKRPLVPLALRAMSGAIVVASTKRDTRYEGRTLREVARMRGAPILEAVLDLLAEEDAAVTVTVHLLDEADLRTVLADSHTMIGTDGMPTLRGKPHPRGYGTYPRVLEQYVGRLGLFSLEAAIHKMTGMPAAKFGLADRGRIAPGYYADLVMFDPRRVRDRATYADPKRAPDGIEAVFVGGRTVYAGGRLTGARPGRVLHGAGTSGGMREHPRPFVCLS